MKMQVMEKALALWPGLADQIDISPDGWRASVLARRDDATVSRILLLLTDPNDRKLVLKHQSRPQQPDEFETQIRAHLAAQDAHPTGVPALLAFDIKEQAAAMEYVPGLPMSIILENTSPDGHRTVLRSAGQWLAQFHRATPNETRVFQPKHTLGYLRRILAEQTSKERTIAEPALFRRVATNLCNRQSEFENQSTKAAVTHGDLHMRNLLMQGNTVWGIDFASDRIVPVGHDIGRLLADYAILRAPRVGLRPGEILPDWAIAAFFEGYDLVTPQDPSVQLLLPHRVLAEWWGLPALPEMRNAAQERRLQGILALMRR